MTITRETAIAAERFGLGARPGELQRIGADPHDWLFRQMRSAPLIGERLASSRDIVIDFLDFRDARKRAKKSGEKLPNVGKVMRPHYVDAVVARTAQAVETESPFAERLVHFWSNHFAVSADNPQIVGLAGSFENEAIRPHVFGRFGEMLKAVEQHPAMLIYLNNIQSVGPNSLIARRAAKAKKPRELDINENLAREILELHTLGVDGGYTQKDVTTFAAVITGWTVGGLLPGRADRGKRGKFAFNDLLHEPGGKTLLGKTYADAGLDQGEAVLADLARAPATAAFIATKLARHFIDDDPPVSAVAHLAQVFYDSDGDLTQVYRELITLDQTWELAGSKYKSPHDYLIGLYRSFRFEPEKPQQAIGPLTLLGQPTFRPGSPAGWPDTAAGWSGGESLMKRVELAVTAAGKIGNRIEPLTLAEAIQGPLLSRTTRRQIERAESFQQGLALLFASPEFMRR